MALPGANSFAKTMPQTGSLKEKEFLSHDGFQSLLFIGGFVRGGAGLWAGSAGAGVALGTGCFRRAKPNAIKNAIYECGLESKGDAWVQFRSAYYLYAHHLSHLRRGSGVSAALCGGVYGFERGGVRGHAGVCAAAGRRTGLGLGQGRADVGVRKTVNRAKG